MGSEGALNSALQRLVEAFSAAGYQLYLVGGTVRDLLLGRPSTDFDLATDAPPAGVKRLLHAAGAEHVWTVGERFGTIGARLEGADRPLHRRGEILHPHDRKDRHHLF